MTPRPTVLFVCVHNAGRSQMAAGFLRQLAGEAVEVRSAGSDPGPRINPAAVEAMAEVGVDIRGQSPRLLTREAVEAADVVITMGCGDACPVLPGVSYRDWALEDPAGKGLQAVRAIRDEIRTRVRRLVDELVPQRRGTDSLVGMSDNQMLVLNRADLDGLGLTWTEIIDVLEDAFRQKARGLVQNPPKPKVTSREDAFIHAMPAYLGGSDRIGLKWVAGYEQNNAKGLPYIYGVMIMNDPETGRPVALLDGGWITEMRTPGVSGVTMRHVPGDFKHLAIVGCGLQGQRHLEVALEVHPGLTHITAYDRNADRVQRMFEEKAGNRVTRLAGSPAEAVDGADLVITTITVPLDPKLDCDNTDPNALLLPVDYDDAMSPKAFHDAVIYCVDDIGQYTSVADDLYFFGLPKPETHLAAVVAGEVDVPTVGRRMFLNMGIAMDDVALSALVLDRATAAGAGRYIEFP